MPSKPKVPCKYPLCRELIEPGQRYCEKHKKLKPITDEVKRSSTAMGYDAKWRKVRLSYLRENPLCVECLKKEIITPATIIDHIEPHKGNRELFWDKSNWQPLCKMHHDVKTGKEK